MVPNHNWGQAGLGGPQAQQPYQDWQQQPWNAQQQQAWQQQAWDAQQQGWQQQAWNMQQQPSQAWQAQPQQQPWNTHESNHVWSGRQLGGDLAAEPSEFPATAPEAQEPAGKPPPKAIGLILNILTICFTLFLVAGSTIFAFSNSETKSLFGYRFYNVLTPSMEPAFRPGDMIFVRLVNDPSQVRVNDIVTFSPSINSDAFLTHRVTELLPGGENQPARMVTKGDANNAADPPVSLNAVIGVHRFTIPYFGNIIDMMRTNLVMVIVCFAAIFLLITVLRAYFAAKKQDKKNKAPPEAALPPEPLQPSPYADPYTLDYSRSF